VTDVDVRELYRDHEHLVDGAAERLLPAVRRLRRRRRIKERMGYAAVALAVAGIIAVVAISVPTRHTPSTPTSPGPRVTRSASGGYRIESSLGVQISVPQDWTVNDVGCPHQDGRPTVVLGGAFEAACLMTVPVPKEIADIESSANFSKNPLQMLSQIGVDASELHERRVTIDGVAAYRADGPISGGGYGGWIRVPSIAVMLMARTDSEAMLTHILDSTDVVTTDHVGCPVTAPRPGRPSPSGGTTFVDPHPTAITVCFYGGVMLTGRLWVSTRRTGNDATDLATALNAAAVGSNPNYPHDCEHPPGAQPIDALLRIEGPDGRTHNVTAVFQSCVDVRLDNGRQYRRLTQSLIALIMEGTNAGYGFGRAVTG
jgi:hypothetical protein